MEKGNISRRRTKLSSTYIGRAKHPSTLCTEFNGDTRELYGGLSFLMVRRCIRIVHLSKNLDFDKRMP